MPNERGYSLCTDGRKITKGRTAVGSPTNVVVPGCPSGLGRVGIFHTHPGGTPHLSALDIAEAKRLGIPLMCVKARGVIKCYRMRGRRK